MTTSGTRRNNTHETSENLKANKTPKIYVKSLNQTIPQLVYLASQSHKLNLQSFTANMILWDV